MFFDVVKSPFGGLKKAAKKGMFTLALFKKVCAPNHSLYHLLPPYPSTDLRLRGHPFRLPEYCTDLHKKSFIVRTLYKYIKLDGCIVWNAHNTVLGEEALLIHIVSVGYAT